jgi:DNA-binding response OmpR family regulator
VVDDDDETRDELVRSLAAAGFDARGADTENAQRIAAEHAPATVILDLAVDDAIDVATQLKGSIAKIVAIVTPTEPLRAEAHRAGVDFFLLRPCGPKHVIDIVRRLGT